MRLGIKTLIPTLILLALLVAASAALFFDQRSQQQSLERNRHQLQAGAQLAEDLSRTYEGIGVEALAFRMDRKQRRVDAIAEADGYALKIMQDYVHSVTDERERRLLSAVAESRTRANASRVDFITAIRSGEDNRIQPAFERWYIHRTLLISHIEDLSAYTFNRFAGSITALEQERVRLLRNMLLGIALAIAVVAAAFIYFRRAISEPLAVLAAQMAAFGDGTLGERLDRRLVGRGDEIGVLAAAYNRMAGEIEELNRTLEDRVAQRTAQLAAANKELEAFAYSLSHDLRAPLRAIDGFSQVLLEDYEDKLDDQGKDSLHRVRAASQRMAGLIDDMLELSRATRGEIDIVDVDLSALAEGIVAKLRAAEPKREVDVSIQPAMAVRADARLMRVVLHNLLDNAWKFTGRTPGARIEVGAEDKDGELVCHVRDNGAGFDMAHAAGLFTPFQRLHRASEFPGNGISLAAVKRVLALLGGRAWAEGGVNRGATFHFALPAVPPSPR